MELAVFISIVGFVLSVVNFFANRRDKSSKDAAKDAYQQGKIDRTLEEIDKKLTKIEMKLDNQDRETEAKINDALQHHINEYHKK